MKLKLLSTIALSTIYGIAFGATGTVIINATTANTAPINATFANPKQGEFANSISSIVTNVNQLGASVGVSSSQQAQWVNSDTNGASVSGTYYSGNNGANGISKDLGTLFYLIDNYGNAYTSNALTFSSASGSWTLAGGAPTATTAISLTDISNAANNLGTNLGNQTNRVIALSGDKFSTAVTTYNSNYVSALGGNVTGTLDGASYATSTAAGSSGNIYQANKDYAWLNTTVTNANTSFTNINNSINTLVTTNLYDSVLNGNTTLSNVYTYQSGNTSGNITNTASAAPATVTFNGVNYYSINNKYYATYADYISGTIATNNISLNIISKANGMITPLQLAPVSLSLGTTYIAKSNNKWALPKSLVTTASQGYTVNGTAVEALLITSVGGTVGAGKYVIVTSDGSNFHWTIGSNFSINNSYGPIGGVDYPNVTVTGVSALNQVGTWAQLQAAVGNI